MLNVASTDRLSTPVPAYIFHTLSPLRIVNKLESYFKSPKMSVATPPESFSTRSLPESLYMRIASPTVKFAVISMNSCVLMSSTPQVVTSPVAANSNSKSLVSSPGLYTLMNALGFFVPNLWVVNVVGKEKAGIIRPIE